MPGFKKDTVKIGGRQPRGASGKSGNRSSQYHLEALSALRQVWSLDLDLWKFLAVSQNLHGTISAPSAIVQVLEEALNSRDIARKCWAALPCAMGC